MDIEEELKKEFDANEGSFILKLRCELFWDKKAFKSLTSLMFKVAERYQSHEQVPFWIANGFWYCDTWIREWTSHDNFPKPESEYYIKSLEILSDLAYLLFNQENPYQDNTLEKLIEN